MGLIRLRGGTETEWDTADPTLAAREVGVTTDTHRLKVGDGVNAWSDLPWAAGEAGPGVPTGGDTGDLLVKASGDDYDTEWAASGGGGVPAGGSTGQALVKASGADGDTTWSSLADWSTYTPALTAITTNPTLGAGNSKNGRYTQIGKLVVATVQILLGTTGFDGGSGGWICSLPVQAKHGSSDPTLPAGWGYAYNGGVSYTALAPSLMTTTDPSVAYLTTPQASAYITGASFGSGGSLVFTAIYEAA